MRLPTREVDNHITHTLQLWKGKSVHPCQKSPSNHYRLPTPENVVCLFDGAKVMHNFGYGIQNIPHVPVWGKWGIYFVILGEVLGGSLFRFFVFSL